MLNFSSSRYSFHTNYKFVEVEVQTESFNIKFFSNNFFIFCKRKRLNLVRGLSYFLLLTKLMTEKDEII